MLPAERLQQAFDRIDAALGSGDLAALPALAEQLDAGVAQLLAHPPMGPALEQLHQRTLATQQLLAAARDGITAARARLDEIAAVRSGIVTYDGAGNRRLLPNHSDHAHRA